MIMEINRNEHIFVSGRTRYGKTYFVKRLFEAYMGQKDAIFVDIKREGAKDFQHPKKIPVVQSVGDAFRALKKQYVVYLMLPSEGDIDDYMEKQINPLMERALQRGNITIFIDEVAIVCSSNKIAPAHYKAMISGLSRGVNVVNITQRPNVVHNTILSESGYKILFMQQLEADRDKIKGVTGEEIADRLQHLEKYHFLFIEPDNSYYEGKMGENEVMIIEEGVEGEEEEEEE